MAEVQYVEASRIFPGNPPVKAVKNLNLDIADGEFLVLVGPSGCGKSTALRMLAGLEEVNEGEIRISGTDVSRKPPKDRDIAMVFQNYALYPHMSVADNMGFALKLAGVNKTERDTKVREAAKLLDLERYLDRKPKALSGGQRQRGAMGRAIVRSPAVFLMDEPLSNLDAKLRVETRANIAALQARLGTTTIYVTHDQVEAMTMGHRVAVLKDGVLQQVNTPRSLYDKPGNAFVAGFIGSPAMNLKTVPVVEGAAQLGPLAVPLPRGTAEGLSQVTLGVRPEAFSVATDGQPGLPLRVDLAEELGADAYVYGTAALDGGTTTTAPAAGEGGGEQMVVRVDGRHVPSLGDTMHLVVDPTAVHLFHPETGERLSD